MSYLLIENKGELDISSLILIGASTKRGNDNMIGFYGSGNKYAIATLLRKGVPFKIFSGKNEVVITTEEVIFRDVPFKKILINGQPTSLTTDMGPEWEEWMAIREWVSNSIDEGSSRIDEKASTTEGEAGYTRFYIELVPSIKELVSNWNTLFTYSRKDIVYKDTTQNFTLFEQSMKDQRLLLFRKGIKVYEDLDRKALYHYDMDNFPINESRIVSSIAMAGSRVCNFLATINDVKVIKRLLKNCTTNSPYWEAHLDWKWNVYQELSSAWSEAIEGKLLVVDTLKDFFVDVVGKKPHYLLSVQMASMLIRKIPGTTVYGLNDDGDVMAFKPVEKTPKIEHILEEALTFLKKTRYEVKYPIQIVSFDNNNTLGQAHNNKILLSDRVFTLGKKEVVSTIIEENEHLATGLPDCTRGFQNHFINLYLSEKEDRFNTYL